MTQASPGFYCYTSDSEQNLDVTCTKPASALILDESTNKKTEPKISEKRSQAPTKKNKSARDTRPIGKR